MLQLCLCHVSLEPHKAPLTAPSRCHRNCKYIDFRNRRITPETTLSYPGLNPDYSMSSASWNTPTCFLLRPSAREAVNTLSPSRTKTISRRGQARHTKSQNRRAAV